MIVSSPSRAEDKGVNAVAKNRLRNSCSSAVSPKDIVPLAARDPVVSAIKPQRLVIGALPGLPVAID